MGAPPPLVLPVVAAPLHPPQPIIRMGALPAAPWEQPASPARLDELDLMSSIARLLETGEAWSDAEAPATAPATAPAPAGVPAQRSAPFLVERPVVVPVPVAVAQVAVAPVAAVAPAAAASLGPPPARISLGFRDGTTTALDPSSEQALALAELSALLAGRD